MIIKTVNKIFPGQRWRDCEQQGRDEGLRHHGARGQGVRGPVAQDRQQRLLHRLIGQWRLSWSLIGQYLLIACYS